jgi:hypothetical protein
MAGAEAVTAARVDGDVRTARNGHHPPAPARRRSVPGGRAILGGLLVAAAVVGLFYASTRTDTGPRQSWVVARHALAPGARLTAADLRAVPIDLPPDVAARAFARPSELVGATLIAPLGQGDLVQASTVVAKASGPVSRELTFPVSRATLTDSLEQGERVDVVATYGSGADAFSTVVLRQALVVNLDRGRDRVGDQGDATMTVAIDDPADAVAFAHAVQTAKLTVVRATGAAPIGGTGSSFRQPSAPSAPGATSGRP